MRHHLEAPQKVSWLARLHYGEVWWGGMPTTKSRRLRMLGVEMIEPKPKPFNLWPQSVNSKGQWRLYLHRRNYYFCI